MLAGLIAITPYRSWSARADARLFMPNGGGVRPTQELWAIVVNPSADAIFWKGRRRRQKRVVSRIFRTFGWLSGTRPWPLKDNK